MRSLLVALVSALACSPAAPPAEHVSIAPPVASAAPTDLEIPSDAEHAYELGLQWWTSGRKHDALRAFRAARETLAKKSSIEPGPGGDVVREGDWLVVKTSPGALVLRAASGEIERWLDVDADSLAALGSGLVGAADYRDSALTVIDVATGARIERIERASNQMHRGAFFAVWGYRAAPYLELWDAPGRKRLRTFEDPALDSVTGVELADSDRALVVLGMRHTVVWDTSSGAKLLSYETVGMPSAPAFSADGRFVAYGAHDTKNGALTTTTVLADRSSFKVLATSHVLWYPVSFAFGDKWLAVGGLRKACLLAVPSLRTVACSPEVRPHFGPDDDLQDAYPTFVSPGMLAIETADGSMLVVRVPSMSVVWKGRARLAKSEAGASYLADFDDHELYVLEPPGSFKHVRKLADDEVLGTLAETRRAEDVSAMPLVNAKTCHVDRWVFPIEACGGPHP